MCVFLKPILYYIQISCIYIYIYTCVCVSCHHHFRFSGPCLDKTHALKCPLSGRTGRGALSVRACLENRWTSMTRKGHVLFWSRKGACRTMLVGRLIESFGGTFPPGRSQVPCASLCLLFCDCRKASCQVMVELKRIHDQEIEKGRKRARRQPVLSWNGFVALELQAAFLINKID